MNDRLLRLLTGYVLPLLGLIVLFFLTAIYLNHHGTLLPTYNR